MTKVNRERAPYLYPSTFKFTSATGQAFVLEEFYKQNEAEYRRLGTPAYDLTVRIFCLLYSVISAHPGEEHPTSYTNIPTRVRIVWHWETTNTHLSSIFQCTNSIRACITPFTSTHFLDF